MTTKGHRDKFMDELYEDSTTLPDEVERWIVTVLREQEFSYVNRDKIPKGNEFRVGMAWSDLERAFARREVSQRIKNDPRRYGHRRGCRWMHLSSTTSLLLRAANDLREALGLPQFALPKKKERPDWKPMVRDIKNGDRVEVAYWNAEPQFGTIVRFRMLRGSKTGCFFRLDGEEKNRYLSEHAGTARIRKLSLLEQVADAARD